MCAGCVGHLALMKAVRPLLRSLDLLPLPVLVSCAYPRAPVRASLLCTNASPSALVTNYLSAACPGSHHLS